MPFLGPLVACLCAAAPSPSALYVAPGGADTNPGTLARPFGTLARARDAIRLRRQASGEVAPVTVLVRGGTYQLRTTLALDARDSHVTYQAYGRERPVLTGGAPLTRFTAHRGKVLAVDLTGTPLAGRAVKVVVFDGERMEMARYPNRDLRDLNGGRWAFVDGTRYDMYADSPALPGSSQLDPKLDFWQRNRPELTRALRLRAADARRWANVAGAEVSIFPRFNWSHCMAPVESLDADGRTMRIGPGCYYEIRPGDRYFVRGVPEELDAPGEWIHDRTSHRLLFLPPAPLAGKPVYAASIVNAIEAEGCTATRLEGFTIECAEGSGVVLRNCAESVIARCTIRNLGDVDGSGVVIEGGRRNAVIGCDIHDVGRHGVRLGGGDPYTLSPGANLADNNVIRRVGLVGRDGNGIELTGALNRVAHNLITDIPHAGILMWGSAHTIEYNRLLRTCLETEDAGAIGGGAIDWLGWQGAVIRYNWIADTMGFGYDARRGRWRSPYFATALYPDWAASGVTIVGNVLLRAPRSCLLLHSGRDNVIENNVLIADGEAASQMLGWTTATGFWSTMVDGWARNYETAIRSPEWQKMPNLKDPRKAPLPDGRVMYGNVSTHNVLVTHAPSSRMYRWEDVPFDRNRSDHNVVWASGQPPRTGALALEREIGPNLLANPGAEEGPADGVPTGWAWSVKAHESVRIAVEEGPAHEGRRALVVETGAAQADAKAGALTMIAPGRAYAFRPGRVYRFSGWLRCEGGPAGVSVQAYSWKQDTHNRTVSSVVQVDEAWRPFDLLFRLPSPGDPDYRRTMDTFYVRFVMPQSACKVFIDDLSLREAKPTDEWTAWKRLGQDRGSVVADPLFVDAAHDDYRLKPGSPALKLGFRPLPFERMGPYRSPLRASWPAR